jgi:thioredoxin 1
MAIEFLDFYADWCGPCRIMEPTLQALSQELGERVKITKIDVDNENEKAMQYGVMSIPTYIILKDGQEIERFVGATSKDVLKSKLEANLV